MIRTLSFASLLFVPALAFAQSASTTSHPAATAPAAPPAASAAPSGKSPAAATADASGSPVHYASLDDATSKCSGDTVVWANPTSKALHHSGDRYFGKSKHGFYACEKDAIASGYHLAGHHKHKKSA